MPKLEPKTIATARLVLRPFTPADAPAVQRLAGDPEIARWTFIPHPYDDGIAEAWIDSHPEGLRRGSDQCFAITLAEDRALVGAVSLMNIDHAHGRAELGYWIAREHWGRGFAVEAGRAVLEYAFAELDLHRVHAWHFAGNERSGAVMRRLGMEAEGRLRDHFFRDGRRHDAVLYGIVNPRHRP